MGIRKLPDGTKAVLDPYNQDTWPPTQLSVEEITDRLMRYGKSHAKYYETIGVTIAEVTFEEGDEDAKMRELAIYEYRFERLPLLEPFRDNEQELLEKIRESKPVAYEKYFDLWNRWHEGTLVSGHESNFCRTLMGATTIC